jgi:hypothetical protein
MLTVPPLALAFSWAKFTDKTNASIGKTILVAVVILAVVAILLYQTPSAPFVGGHFTYVGIEHQVLTILGLISPIVIVSLLVLVNR